MCGRYTVRSIQPVVELFGIALPPEFQPRYNIAPSQDVLVVRASPPSHAEPAAGSNRRADLLRWGLVPSWAQDRSVGNRMINARAETAAERPAFRDAMQRRRCLVPADGFYEWQAVEGSKRRQPHFIRMKGDRPFAFAGLWESWRRRGDKVESFTILTTSANELVAPIHDRMPVVVAPADFDRWLDPAVAAADVAGLLKPYSADEMESQPVGTQVNNPANDDPSCAEPWK
jgi:putative SOS response-associated peptidase YedK